MQDQDVAQEQQGEVFDFPKKEELKEHYEILVLVGGGLTADQAEPVFEEVKSAITSFNGEITLDESLGSRTLAYTVEGSRSGVYFVAEFNLLKSQLALLQEKLRIHKKVTRFLIIKKREKTAEELAEEERIQKKIDARKQERYMKAQEEQRAEEEEKKAATKKPAAKTVATATTTTKSAPEKKVKKAVPVKDTATEEKPKETRSIEDLDDEIDKLLSNDFDI